MKKTIYDKCGNEDELHTIRHAEFNNIEVCVVDATVYIKKKEEDNYSWRELDIEQGIRNDGI